MIHWFDLFVAFFLLISAGWSYFRGFVKETFSIASLVAGYIAGSLFYRDAAALISPNSDKTLLAEGASFILIFMVTSIVMVMAGVYLRRWLHLSEALGAADKMAGTAMGVVKGVAILAIFVYPIALLPGLKQDFTEKSIAGPLIIGASATLMEHLAPGLARNIEKANSKSDSFKERAAIKEKYGKTLEKLNGELTGKSEFIKKKLGLAKDTADEKQSNAPKEKSGITDKDRKDLDNLINKVDK